MTIPVKQTLAEKAYELIEELIVTLELPPGSNFSETEICSRLKIGRTPVREALQRLAAEKLVATQPRRGMLVTEINIAEHLALLETRRVLDRLIASRAARRATNRQRDELLSLANQIFKVAASGDLGDFMRLDRESDHILETASKNKFAVSACAPLHAHCRRFWYCYQENGDLTQSAKLHGEVITVVAKGDVLMAESASANLLDYLDKFTRSVLDVF